MNLKKLPLALKVKNSLDFAYANDYPTLADLMRDQNISSKSRNTVHQRRDLDSLG